MKPSLVTGASGLFGGEVARQLVDQGIPVRIYVRDARRAPALTTPGQEGQAHILYTESLSHL